MAGKKSKSKSRPIDMVEEKADTVEKKLAVVLHNMNYGCRLEDRWQCEILTESTWSESNHLSFLHRAQGIVQLLPGKSLDEILAIIRAILF